MAEETNVKKVQAWLLPEFVGEAVPIWDHRVRLGYNPMKNDVILDSPGAAICQAEVYWDRERLHLADCSGNGLTLLNGTAVELGQDLEVFHGDTVTLAGHCYCVHRIDGVVRAVISFFDEEGNLLSSVSCRSGEKVAFPEAMQKEDYLFAGWKLIEGTDVDAAGCCIASAAYRAEYIRRQKRFTVTFRADGGFVNSDSTERKAEFGYEQEVQFPALKDLVIVDGCKLGEWTFCSGTKLDNGRCMGDVIYEMTYPKDTSENSGGTTRMDTYLVDMMASRIVPVNRFNMVRIGSGRDCWVQDDSLEDICAVISGKTLELESFSDENVQINGRKIYNGQHVLLNNGDAIEIGNRRFQFRCPIKMTYGTIVNAAGESILLEHGEMLLGSKYQHAFFSHSPYISRRHAVVTYTGGQYVLEDISSNGTFINSKPVEKDEKVVLNPGDSINFADMPCKFFIK